MRRTSDEGVALLSGAPPRPPGQLLPPTMASWPPLQGYRPEHRTAVQAGGHERLFGVCLTRRQGWRGEQGYHGCALRSRRRYGQTGQTGAASGIRSAARDWRAPKSVQASMQRFERRIDRERRAEASLFSAEQQFRGPRRVGAPPCMAGLRMSQSRRGSCRRYILAERSPAPAMQVTMQWNACGAMASYFRQLL
jgi:hypothetical protein